MANYTCPLCNETMAHDLILFLSHGEDHIITEIKKSNPHWVAENGACAPCVEYYRKAMRGN